MTTDLIVLADDLRLVRTYHEHDAQVCKKAADALESQARRVGELEREIGSAVHALSMSGLAGPRPWPTEGDEAKLRIWCNMVRDVVDERDALQAKLAEAQRDAGRYRWLRDQRSRIAAMYTGESLDGYVDACMAAKEAAIDAAMQGEK